VNRKKFFSIYFFTLFVFLYGCIEKQNPKSTSTKSQSLQSSSPPKTRPNAKPTPGYVIALQEKKRLQQDKKAHVRRYHALRKKRHKQQKQRREQYNQFYRF